MKRTWISGIRINGFGHFADFELSDFGPGVTVIHGANEAGKSTLLAYIRAALFGLKSGSKPEAYLPTRGGAHGGHILLNDDLGLTYDVLRSKGTHGGTLAVSVSDGRHMDDGKPLIAELLGHTTGPLFDSVFAFGLGELEDLKKLDSGEVSARIYGAGMGAKELPSLLASIDKAADALFKKRGQQPAVTLTLAELRTAQSRLAEVETQAGEYADLRRRQDALRRELDEFAQRLEEVRQERTKGAQLLRGLGDVPKLQAVESALSETPKFEGFPEDAVAQLRSLSAAIRLAEEDARLIEEAAATVAVRAGRAIPDEGLLAEREFIALLARDRGDFDKSVADLPKREAEAAQAQAEVERALLPLGATWGAARVAAFVLTPEMSETIRAFQERVTGVADDYKVARQDLLSAGRIEEEAQAELARLEAMLAAQPPTLEAGELQRREQQVAVVRRLLRDHEECIRSSAALQVELEESAAAPSSPPRLSVSRWLPFAIAAVLLAAAGVAVGGFMLPFALAGAALSAGIAAVMVVRLQHGESDEELRATRLMAQLEAAEREVEQSFDAVVEANSIFGETMPNEDVLFEIELMLRRQRDSLARRLALVDGRSEAAARLERATERREVANGAVAEAEGAQRLVADEWRAWLTAHDFGDEFSPSTVASLFGSLANAQGLLVAARALDHRVERIREDLDTFVARVTQLCLRWGAQAPGGLQLAALAADGFVARLEAATPAVARRDSDRQRLEEEQPKVEAALGRIHLGAAEREELLRAAGATDEESFLLRARVHQHRAELEEELRVLRAGLAQLASSEETVDDFLVRLRRAKAEEVRAAIDAANLRVGELEQERAISQREFGANEARLLALTSDEAASQTRAEVSVLREQLLTEAHQWAVLTLARTMLTAARTKYEEERQPGVVRDAQQFFRQMTGGQYTNIVVPIGSTSPVAVAADGTRRTPEQLSRGTREQLYLALRFGLIRQFAVQERALPLIVDEVLVNFDPGRAVQAARAFAEVARDHQVLVFTCQPAMVEMFKSVAPDAKVIELGSAAQR